MKILAVKPELCTGCGICEEVCSQTFYKEENPEKSAIRIGERSPETEPNRFTTSILSKSFCPRGSWISTLTARPSGIS